MNTHDPDRAWQRLVRAARQVPEEGPASAPFGFATRVAALAMSRKDDMSLLLVRFSLRALGVACLLALLCVVLNYSSLTSGLTSSSEEALMDEDPVVLLLSGS